MAPIGETRGGRLKENASQAAGVELFEPSSPAGECDAEDPCPVVHCVWNRVVRGPEVNVIKIQPYHRGGLRWPHTYTVRQVWAAGQAPPECVQQGLNDHSLVGSAGFSVELLTMPGENRGRPPSFWFQVEEASPR